MLGNRKESAVVPRKKIIGRSWFLAKPDNWEKQKIEHYYSLPINSSYGTFTIRSLRPLNTLDSKVLHRIMSLLTWQAADKWKGFAEKKWGTGDSISLRKDFRELPVLDVQFSDLVKYVYNKDRSEHRKKVQESINTILALEISEWIVENGVNKIKYRRLFDTVKITAEKAYGGIKNPKRYEAKFHSDFIAIIKESGIGFLGGVDTELQKLTGSNFEVGRFLYMKGKSMGYPVKEFRESELVNWYWADGVDPRRVIEKRMKLFGKESGLIYKKDFDTWLLQE